MKHTIYLTATIALFTACKTNANNEAATQEVKTEATITVDTNTQIIPPTVETTTYNFEAHSDFQAFWADFKKAVLANDKETVAKMTLIPFHDEYQESYYSNYGGDKPLTANTISDFLNKYDKIFIPPTLDAVKKNKYIDYDIGDGFEEEILKGEFVLKVESQLSRSFDLHFKKNNGVYKLNSMPYYP